MVTLDQKIRTSADVMFQEVGGEAVLLDLKRESYLGLNETGTRVWRLLQQRGDLHWVLDRMLDEYDVDAAQAERDLIELVKQLGDAGLVTMEAEGASEG